MQDKKELNQEELEKVSGGGHFANPLDIAWLFVENATILVKITSSVIIQGKVTKRGWIGSRNNIYDVYYVENKVSTNINGWYRGSNFISNSINCSYKENLTSVHSVDW